MRRWAVVLIVVACGLRLMGQVRAGVYGTYSNLTRSSESGDLNGYELTLVAQPGSAYAVFECAQGAPSKTVFVPVQLTNRRVSFAVNDPDNACNGAYTGLFVAAGVQLHSSVVGDTQLVPRHLSFWVTAAAPTKYARATDPLFDQLAVACPAKNLEEMAPADLDLQIEEFMPLLTQAQNARFEARAKKECKDSIAGVGCGNVAFLELAEKERYLQRFVKALCAADLACTGQAVCGPVEAIPSRRR